MPDFWRLMPFRRRAIQWGYRRRPALHLTILFIDKPIGLCDTISVEKTKGELT